MALKARTGLANCEPHYWRGNINIDKFAFVALPLMAFILLGLINLDHRIDMQAHVPYRKELRLAVAIRHMPTTAIPARDRPTIAAMRAGKRLTNFQFDRLRTDVRPYLQARQRRLLQQRMKSVARRGAHAR
jgi:hypothetical protein